MQHAAILYLLILNWYAAKLYELLQYMQAFVVHILKFIYFSYLMLHTRSSHYTFDKSPIISSRREKCSGNKLINLICEIEFDNNIISPVHCRGIEFNSVRWWKAINLAISQLLLHVQSYIILLRNYVCTTAILAVHRRS